MLTPLLLPVHHPTVRANFVEPRLRIELSPGAYQAPVLAVVTSMAGCQSWIRTMIRAFREPRPTVKRTDSGATRGIRTRTLRFTKALLNHLSFYGVVRREGVGLSFPAWKAGVLATRRTSLAEQEGFEPSVVSPTHA